MNKLKLFLQLTLILFVASCTKDQFVDPADQLNSDDVTLKCSFPKIKIAVASDFHYLNPALMPDDYVNNPDFQKAMAGDRKLIELSDPVFRKTMSEIIAEKPDILMVCGDLSFNGEYLSHMAMKDFLQEIENNGIRVYVIPGNNDIGSPDAVSFKTSPPSKVENIVPGQFRTIYQNFGYNEAAFSDPASLSYLCKPFPNLWIMGIDAFTYTDKGDGTYTVKAAFNPGTMDWIEEVMAEAREKNITVLAMMHSGLLEHYTGQKALEGGFVSGNLTRAQELLDAGISLVFNGHHHGNDVTSFTSNGKTLYNIETGSLITPPSPYRIMTLDDNFIKIETRHITRIDSELPGGMDFLTYSYVTINSRLDKLFTNVAIGWFGQTLEEAQIIAPVISRAWLAHFAGDEKLSPEERRTIASISEFTNPALITALNSIWTDLPPFSDNKIHIKLK